MPRTRRAGGIFVYGYHGFHNVGAECRMLAMVSELRRRLPETPVTVSSFRRDALEPVPGATVAAFHPIRYRWAARPHVEQADVVVLAEGNMLTDEFSPHMVLACTTAIEHAHRSGTEVVGLALDSGRLSPERTPRVVAALDRTDLLTVRTPEAAAVLRSMGVQREIEVTADCAVSMPLHPDPGAVARRLGIEGRPVHGIAPVDFHMWPAKISPIGRPRDFVRWPFKATWGDGGRVRTAELVAAWGRYGRSILERDRAALVAMIVMDPADRRIARAIAETLPRERVLVLSGSELDCPSMSAALGSMRTIATSRYHALVLALPWGVPFVALGHDTRMRFIADEIGLGEFFVPHDAAGLAEALIDRQRKAETSRTEIAARLRAQHLRMRDADRRNYDLVAARCAELGHRVVPVEPPPPAALAPPLEADVRSGINA